MKELSGAKARNFSRIPIMILKEVIYVVIKHEFIKCIFGKANE